MVYGGARFLNLLAVAPDLKERVVLVSGFSKTFAMATGWRIGCTRWDRRRSSPPCRRCRINRPPARRPLLQSGALAAMTAPREEVDAVVARMHAEFDRRRRAAW